MMIGRFADRKELLGFATVFIGGRTNSLRQDVDHCLGLLPPMAMHGEVRYAPFPAILYCFSTVDLFGALYSGDAVGHTTANAKQYMLDLMQYTDEQVRLLQKLFRHKVVHLAQPKAALEDNGRIISWHYKHTGDPLHLTVCRLPPGCYVEITPTWKVAADHQFRLDIDRFASEIIASAITPPDCYLERLKADPVLQQKFGAAISQIYDPRDHRGHRCEPASRAIDLQGRGDFID